MVNPIIVKTFLIKEISCFENDKLPLHIGCPYGKQNIDEKCALCVRRKEKILTLKSQIIEED